MAVLLDEDFESGTMTLSPSGNSPTITQTQVSTGSYGMEVFLDYDNSPTNYRTEFAEQSRADYVKTYTYSFDIFLPNEYINDSIWEIVAQWHGVPDVGEAFRNPVLDLKTTGGRWEIQSRWDSKPQTDISGDNIYDGSSTWDLGPYIKGEWCTWLFEIQWAHSSDGFINIWKNGRLICHRTGPNCFNDAIGPYFKSGLYKGWTVSEPAEVRTRTLYFDNYKIEST